MSGQQGWVTGTIDRAPCPHCGARIDLRDLRDQNVLDTGHEVQCDRCDRWSEVCAIQPVVMVSLRRATRHGALPAPMAPAGARQIVSAPRQPPQQRRMLKR